MRPRSPRPAGRLTPVKLGSVTSEREAQPLSWGLGGESAAASPRQALPARVSPAGRSSRAYSREALGTAWLRKVGAPGGATRVHFIFHCPPPPAQLVTRALRINCTFSFKSITLINSGSVVLNYSGSVQQPVEKQSFPGTF